LASLETSDSEWRAGSVQSQSGRWLSRRGTGDSKSEPAFLDRSNSP
jgi:hypothetical protein